MNENERERRKNHKEKQFSVESQISKMIESKSKRRAKSISSRRKNVSDKTIIIHYLWHSKAREKECLSFFICYDVYLKSLSFDYFVTLHLLLITIWLLSLYRRFWLVHSCDLRFRSHIIQILHLTLRIFWFV